MRSDFSADAVTVPGTLRVYRQWAVTFGHRFGLCSLMFDVVWRQQEYAECKTYDCVPTPSTTCSCGIYGYYSPTDTFCGVRDLSILYGSVQVSGSVVLGTKGVRAQSATMEAVVVPGPRVSPSRFAVVRALRSTYPGLEVFPSVSLLLESYPPDDVSELIGE